MTKQEGFGLGTAALLLLRARLRSAAGLSNCSGNDFTFAKHGLFLELAKMFGIALSRAYADLTVTAKQV